MAKCQVVCRISVKFVRTCIALNLRSMYEEGLEEERTRLFNQTLALNRYLLRVWHCCQLLLSKQHNLLNLLLPIAAFHLTYTWHSHCSMLVSNLLITKQNASVMLITA